MIAYFKVFISNPELIVYSYFRPSSDEFFVRATVDIESEGRESKETLENQLRYFISNSRAFNPSSPLTVIDKGFDIIQGKIRRRRI